MEINTKKRLTLTIAWSILLTETALIAVNYQEVAQFLMHYGWIAPVILFKSFIKKFILLNIFGILKVLWVLIWHLLKLLLIKLLKTFGIRYGAYFSSKRWQKASQRLRIVSKNTTLKKRSVQRFMSSMRKREYAVIILAFLPIFLILFLFGVAFKITREAMVKTGSELGVTKVAYTTANRNTGFIAKIKRADQWILQRIESSTTKRIQKSKVKKSKIKK